MAMVVGVTRMNCIKLRRGREQKQKLEIGTPLFLLFCLRSFFFCMVPPAEKAYLISLTSLTALSA